MDVDGEGVSGSTDWMQYLKTNAPVWDRAAQARLRTTVNWGKKRYGQAKSKYGPDREGGAAVFWPTEDKFIKYAPRAAAAGLGVYAAYKTAKALKRLVSGGSKRRKKRY